MLIDVAVPEMSLNSLTYESSINLQEGSRVIVEVVGSLHTGFVIGRSEKKLSSDIIIKPVEGIIDNECLIDPDIWNMSLWAAKVCMCGTAEALKAFIPRPFYMGEVINSPEISVSVNGKFNEKNFFHPLDSERVKFFISELEKPGRTLILFPQKETAKSFFKNLPDKLKSEALLWPSDNSKKLWQSWKLIHEKKFRIVIAPPGGISAPLMPEKIIVDDEANPAYILPHNLNLSARSLAGHRASFINAEFITAGRMPSLKTYMRKNPKEIIIPERKYIILSDIYHSRTKKEEINGVKGNIPLTYSLIKNTYRELSKGHNVIWILNRKGEASEIFCEKCGNIITCQKCGGIMQARNDGNILRCRKCGFICRLPEKCNKCGCDFLTGRRPGLDALAKITGKYYNDVHIYSEGVKSSSVHGLILSTQRGLELCGKIDVNLISWLDLDAELWSQDYGTRFNVFNMLMESYWRGRENNPERKVLIQSRKTGMKIAEFLYQGWSRFIPDELKNRYEFMLPPYGYIIEILFSSKKTRENMLDTFMNAGIFVMDPGDDKLPIYVNTDSIETVRKLIEPEMLIRNTKNKYIKITVRNE